MCVVLFGAIVSFCFTGWSDFGVKEPSVSVGIHWYPIAAFAVCNLLAVPDLGFRRSHISEQLLKS